MTHTNVYMYNQDMLLSTTTRNPKYDGLSVDPISYRKLQEDGFRYEMVDGVLKLAPSPFARHNRLQLRFVSALQNYFGSDFAGEIFTDVDVFFPDQGDVLRPDICLLLPENPADLSKWVEGIPDLVGEVHSSSTKLADLGRKSERYLLMGIKEYWLLDPESNRVSIRENRNGKWVFHSDNRSRLLPGFYFSSENK